MNDLTDALSIIQKYLTACLLRLSASALSKAKEALRQLHFNQTLAGLWPTPHEPYWFSPSPRLTNKWGHDLGIPSWRGQLQGHDSLQEQNSLLRPFPEFLQDHQTFRIPLGPAASLRFCMLTDTPKYTDWCNFSSLAHDSQPVCDVNASSILWINL